MIQFSIQCFASPDSHRDELTSEVKIMSCHSERSEESYEDGCYAPNEEILHCVQNDNTKVANQKIKMTTTINLIIRRTPSTAILPYAPS